MKLFIKGKMFDKLDTMAVTGENDEELYYLKKDKESAGQVVTLSGPDGAKIADIEQRGRGGKAVFAVTMNGTEVAVVERRSSIQPKYTVNGPGWEVSGSVFSTKYKVTKGDRPVANLRVTILKSEIDIVDDADPVFSVAVVMAIRLALYFASVTGTAAAAGTVHV